MQIQPITDEPKFRGKVVFYKGRNRGLTDSIQQQISKKFEEINVLVQDKPYDIFISQNKQNPDFYDVAANTSYKKARNIKEYTVKINTGIMPASIVDAAKDAMEMYEKYISKSVKG